MKKEYIIAAKTVEEAITDARIRYGSEGELSFEVLEMPKKGFLGIGSSPAKIKVTVEEEEEDLMAIFGSSKNDAPKPEVKKEEKPRQKKENKPSQPRENREGGEKKKENNGKAPKNAEKPVEKAPKAEKQPAPEKKEEKPAQAPEKKEVKEITDEEIRVTVPEMEVALAFVKNLLADMEIDAEAQADLTPDENGTVSRVLDIVGPGAGKLIGHHGETLDSIQYLANLALNRKHGSRRHEYVKVVVDIEGYRAKREDTLRQFARRMADKALKYKRNVLLEPMNPYERRIIHSEVQGIEGVSTHSVGADENRKIVITYDAKNGQGNTGSGRKNNRRRHHRRDNKAETVTPAVTFNADAEEEEGLSLED
ncbi:MAG: Jag N-terminal domain-containing protein [Clostridia bacterium]|nr:Jag N-terminal domain-containing protein [Clostridia bacterium]